MLNNFRQVYEYICFMPFLFCVVKQLPSGNDNVIRTSIQYELFQVVYW